MSESETTPKEIIIASGFPLAMNPRVVKEADALTALGHKVTVLTAIFNKADRQFDTEITNTRAWRRVLLADADSNNSIRKFHWLALRIRKAIFRRLHQAWGLQSQFQLGYCTSELIQYCKKNKADHYSLHLESALATAPTLIKSNRSYSVDFEDWYSQDLTQAQQAERPLELLKELEATALGSAAFSTAASTAMGHAIAASYQVNAPLTVYNCFDILETAPVLDASLPLKICWFSQTVGPTRGLEALLSVTRGLSEVEVHLMGGCSDAYQIELEAIDPKVKFHGHIPTAELPGYLTQFHVGFAGESSEILNRELTVTNKVFQYLVAGLPIIASKTQGQREIADNIPRAFTLYENAQELEMAISHWQAADRLLEGRQTALQAAVTRYNWQIESVRLTDALASR